MLDTLVGNYTTEQTLEGDPKKSAHIKKLAHNKNSIIFAQLL